LLVEKVAQLEVGEEGGDVEPWCINLQKLSKV